MMRLSRSFLKRTSSRSAFLAPFAAILGTVYGIRQAFHSVDSSGHAMSSVVPGILAALVATLAAMLLIVPLAAVWELLSRGSNDDNGAA
jgi:biopolymer transport protein ExbB/TolQ